MLNDISINSTYPEISEKDTQLIEQQLMKIIASSYFKSAKQLELFLKYVIRKTLMGQGEQIKQYTIAIEGLGLGPDFDAHGNPLIRIIAGRVREKLDKYYKSEGIGDTLIITIPKGSYIPTFKKRINTTPQINIGIRSSGPIIALVCFTDTTQSTESNRLLYQLSDNLAAEMSQFSFSRLVVSIPHADKIHSRKVEEEMKNKYQANYTVVLYLHPEEENNRQLHCRIIDVNSGELLWSDNYEIKQKLFLGKECEVCGQISSTILDWQQGIVTTHWARALLDDPKTIPRKHQVLAYYRYFVDNFTKESFLRSVAMCEEVLEETPNDLIANIYFSEYCRREYVYNYGVIENPLERGKCSAQKAIRLKPSSHGAHLVLAQILYNTGEWDQCFHELETVILLNRNHAFTTMTVGYHLCIMNKWEEGMPLVKEAMALSPMYPEWYNTIPLMNEYRQGKYEEALVFAQRIITPTLYWGPLARAACYGQLGMFDKAKIEVKELLKRYPDFATKGQILVQRFLGPGDLSEHIWEGLLKAGLRK